MLFIKPARPGDINIQNFLHHAIRKTHQGCKSIGRFDLIGALLTAPQASVRILKKGTLMKVAKAETDFLSPWPPRRRETKKR